MAVVTKDNQFSPISSGEFDGWMQAVSYFEANPTIAVATSGGADSMSLLLLARDWVADRGGKVISLTVNHNLRPEAASEALQVAAWCRKLAVEHHILIWDSPTKIQSIQASARTARYQLLTNFCRENNILHLLTAHHAGDQVETMFFRLARGSGLEGLSAMSAQSIISSVRLLRPLLHVDKERLIATLRENNQPWIEDPSNHNLLYSRVNIRRQLATSPDESSVRQNAGYIIKNFGKYRNLIERNAVSQLTDTVKLYPMGYAELYYSSGISSKILGSIIQTLNGEEHPPRSEKLDNLLSLIKGNKLKSKRSLGGLIFEPLSSGQIMVYREEKAITPSLILANNQPVLWDKRFLIEYRTPKELRQSVEIRALGSNGLAQIKKLAPSLLRATPPARILRQLPSFWLLEELLAVTHISYMSKQATLADIQCTAKFRPAKALAGSSFFINNQYPL